jgi:hypothetical protein
MAKLDRLGWAAGMCFDAYGVRLGVRVNQPEILPELSALLPPGSTPAASLDVDQIYSVWLGKSQGRTRGFHLLYAGVEARARTLSREVLFEAFEASLRLGVAAAARRRVFVHAGVVGWRGRAIVLPGRSGSGKTTLVAALLRAGASYYSDEFAVIDDQGRVHAFAKPLSIRGGNQAGRRSAEELGSVVGTRPLPIGLIAFSHYRAEGRWRPVPLSPGAGLLALVPHTVPLRRRPQASLAALRKAVEGARLLRSSRGEAEGIAIELLREADPTARGAA